MTFWGGERLSLEGVQKKIVDPFDSSKADSIDCSAFTLTMGAEAYVTPSYGDDPRTSVKQQLHEPRVVSMAGQSRRCSGGTAVIPPGQFAFLLTEETVSIPSDAIGFISLKSKPKFGGLINVSGFHVDPGFQGKLIFSVFNAGPNSIHISRGDSLFLLWISDLSGAVNPKYVKSNLGYGEIPSDLVTKVATENHSLQSLAKRVEDLNKQVTIYASVAAAIGVILGLVLSLIDVKLEFSREKPNAALSAQAGPTTPTPVVTTLPSPSARDQHPQPPGGTQSANSTP